MDDVVKRKFRFETIDEDHSFDGAFPGFIIRKATTRENRERKEQLQGVENSCTTFIKDGFHFLGRRDFLNLDEYRQKHRGFSYEIAEGMKNRFDWVVPLLEEEVQRIEVRLVLAACNLTWGLNQKRIMKFSYGHLIRNWGMTPEERSQIHRRVVEVNPAWQGAVDRIRHNLSILLPKDAYETLKGNFRDLAVKSVYTRHREDLLSLVQEIQRDVFDTEGIIKENVNPRLLQEFAGTQRNIFDIFKTPHDNILYFPENQYLYYTEINLRKYYDRIVLWDFTSPKSDELPLGDVILQLSEHAMTRGRPREDVLPYGNYIGMIPNGDSEIRVIAQKTDYSNDGSFRYWDTPYDELIPTLRRVIEWWKGNTMPGRPVRRQTEALSDLDEDTSWIDDAMDTANDLAEYYDND